MLSAPLRESEDIAPVRMAMLGVYRSGGSAVAGVLRRLGIWMGDDLNEHGECLLLAAQLRYWWREPACIESVKARERIEGLRRWLPERPLVAAKHPLLCLSGPDLLAAWGPNVRWIVPDRPLGESLDSLDRLGWFPGVDREKLLHRLIDARDAFLRDREHLRVPLADLNARPVEWARRLSDYAGVPYSERGARHAAAFIQCLPS